MSTTAFGTPCQATTDAEFRSWGQAISNALAAMGLVKTSDTGQINWTTVLKPASASTMQGYEIWRFADPLQATCPVFFKLEYGSGGTAAVLGMALTVGYGSDGAGNLNAQVGNRRLFSASTTSATPALTYVSGATDRIGVVVNPGVANVGFGFHIERSKDASGNNTSVGICTYTHLVATSPSPVEQFIPQAGIIPVIDLQPFSFCASGNSAVAGTDVGLFPQYPFFGKLLNPKMGLIGYMNGDIQPLISIPVTIYGATHTYLTLGMNAVYVGSNSYAPGRGQGYATSTMMMRWE